MCEIEINGVAVGYGGKVVARNLTAMFHGGELTCLIGRNGIGKSTLLKVLAGFMPPLAGEVLIKIGGKDYDVVKMSKNALSRLVAVVLTDKVDIANVTVEDVVGMGRMPYTGFFGGLSENDRAIVSSAISMTGIGSLAGRDINTLSDGERQKAMIARAVAQQSRVMLLDEPTAFLDYESKVETMRLLHRLAHGMGKIVIASTHDLDIALRNADRIVTIDNGIKDVDKARLMAAIG